MQPTETMRAVALSLLLSMVVAGCTLTPQQQTTVNQTLDSGDAMENADDDAVEDVTVDDGDAVSFTGNVLAGSSSPLLDFNQADYNQALTSGKLILLYFYADWCPICRAEVPKLYAAFNQLQTDQVIGFRVNFNDNQTDSDEEALARTHGVAYQHTKVIIKNGQRVLKSPETWEQERYLEEINSQLK